MTNDKGVIGRLLKKLFCFHLNWTNKSELFSDYRPLRRSKPWPCGSGLNEFRCIECGKIKNFGWSCRDAGYFSIPNTPINFDYEKDLIR